MQAKSSLILGICVLLGLASAGHLVSTTLLKARASSNTVTVKGFSEREVKANIAVWRIGFSVAGNDLSPVTEQARKNEQAVREFLTAQGIAPETITLAGIQVTDAMANQYRNNSVLNDGGRFVVQSTVLVRTPDVGSVETASRKLSDLLQQGVIISNSELDYKFTALNDVKTDMLKEATQNAREAAQQFANDSGSIVGPIQSANQGFFSITSRDGDSEYSGGPSAIDKSVRVVTTVTYYLEK